MSSSPTLPNPPGSELVKIDKAGFKTRFPKFLDRIVFEKRWTYEDLKEFEQWLKQEDYAYKGRKWKEVFKSGAKIVGEDSQVSTPLGKDQPAGGLDLADIRREIAAGRLQKPGGVPPPKTGSFSNLPNDPFAAFLD